jgi:hypothetical protein
LAELARSARPRRYCFYFDEEVNPRGPFKPSISPQTSYRLANRNYAGGAEEMLWANAQLRPPISNTSIKLLAGRKNKPAGLGADGLSHKKAAQNSAGR